MLTILFFAQLREQLKTESFDLSIELPCTIDDVLTGLVEQNPKWAQFIQKRTLLSAVNQSMAEGNHTVIKGDEIAFFPPVTGG
ncbi:MAG: molybdopterin synthase sulfur carrier subunit [Bermanella sp.]|jgi:molybdopterin synthase sulfur carrier subunit